VIRCLLARRTWRWLAWWMLTAGYLFLAWIIKLGFLADFPSDTVLVGFLAGIGFQVGIAMLSDMLGGTVRFN
jgi:sulfate permease, SulP family